MFARLPQLPERLGADHQVAGQGPGPDVEEVEPDPLAGRQPVAATDLPQSGQAGLDLEHHRQVLAEHRRLVEQVGPGADHAHLADEDVEQLGQLVEAGPADERTDRGQPWVVSQLAEPAVLLAGSGIVAEVAGQEPVGVGVHRAELPGPEHQLAMPDPGRTEQQRARRVELHRDGHRQQQRRQRHQGHAGHHHIEGSNQDPGGPTRQRPIEDVGPSVLRSDPATPRVWCRPSARGRSEARGRPGQAPLRQRAPCEPRPPLRQQAPAERRAAA